MTPTNELRFVEREVKIESFTEWDYPTWKTIRVLQQKWVNEELRSDHPDYPEWRDVPLVKEEV